MRVVSLVPSATEILCALGMADQIVGISHDCIWGYEWMRRGHQDEKTFEPSAAQVIR